MAFNPIFTDLVLPFLLVFVVVFAILQKSKILGEEKSQIDAITALVIGLLLIGLPQPRDFIVVFIPWVAVGIAVILVFLILYGFVAGDLSGKNAPGWMKATFGILAALFTLGVVLYVTGLGAYISEAIGSGGGSDLVTNVVIILLVIGAMAFAVFGNKGSSSSSNSESE